MTNRQILLAETPAATLEARHFRGVETAMPRCGPGEVLCRTILASIDPVNRALLRGRSYRAGIQVGDVMAGFAVSEVVDPGDTTIPAGTIVSCDAGWQEYAALPADAVTPIVVRGPLTHHMSALGITGLTAYVGLLDVGRPIAGETVVVSAAAGATGSVVGQLARIHGCRVVGIAGSDAKLELLEDRLGFDAAVGRRSPTFARDLRDAVPDGIDLAFDSVGGAVLDACLARMNARGRIVCCGALSQYDAGPPPAGPRGVPGLVVSQRLRMEGFVVLDHVDRWPEAQERIAGWVGEGRLTVLEEVDDGLDRAPQALVDVLAGRNVGKRMVRVAADPA